MLDFFRSIFSFENWHFFGIDKRKKTFSFQVLLQPQSPLTNPGRINKKHKGEEEEVHSDSESDDDRTIGRISTNEFDENVRT